MCRALRLEGRDGGVDHGLEVQTVEPRAFCLNSFQTTLTPNPEQFYKYHSAMKQETTCVSMRSLNAVKFRCRWSGYLSLLSMIVTLLYVHRASYYCLVLLCVYVLLFGLEVQTVQPGEFCEHYCCYGSSYYCISISCVCYVCHYCLVYCLDWLCLVSTQILPVQGREFREPGL